MEKTTNDIHSTRVLGSVRAFLKDRFNLKLDQERESVTKADIEKGAEFKGANLWILMFAILIASIGLNVNSPAIIIGAMLISPLMGPIIGIGLGAGVYDMPLIRKGARNLLIAMVISILTSTVYFLITPLAEAQSELLSRTQPSLWDVLIAFCGGMAGIIAGSRKEKSNAIPGVAIATALMPPLCTAGYALAHANWAFFFGALFLFFINCVFISVSTFLVVRALKYRKKKFDSPVIEKRVRQLVTAFVVITIIPSVYLAYNLVRKSIFEQKARTFIIQEFDFPETQVIKSESVFDKNGGRMEVTLFGKKLGDDIIEKLNVDLADYGLEKCQLTVRQAYQEENLASREEMEKMSLSLKSGLIEDLYKKNEEVLNSKTAQIELLENQIRQMQSRQYPVNDISEELRIQYDDLNEFSLMDGYVRNLSNDKIDTICFAMVNFTNDHPKSDYQKVSRWLKQRLKVDSVRIIN
ncbi:TIGR00341 family protein [Roseivirga sp. 4D4]|uniref:TIGR00341 family protein n=1 Tax=Roseivirga sp. 4D4 TaxID=1889784 RepID=UPI0008530501|nr:TIGR00341 family protein [Roseivirga sp. 4D4]OEK01126.1 TIGR00341 family protein [Roseivirga sp. 4D4]